MTDKEELVFIMMMEHHSSEQSIHNNIWAYCFCFFQQSSVFFTEDFPF